MPSDSVYYNRYRTRRLNVVLPDAINGVWSSGPSIEDGPILKPKEETWDRDNAWWAYQKYALPWQRRHDTFTDVGGPLFNRKMTAHLDQRIYHLRHETVAHKPFYWYDGPLQAKIITDSAMNADTNLAMITPSSEGVLDALGTSAIARCAPTTPVNQIYVSIGEMRSEGLPKIPGLTALKGKDPAGEFLNYEFGIRPIISDIRSLNETLRNAKDIMRQYWRDSGKRVRRSYNFGKTVSTTRTTSSKNVTGLPGSTNTNLWLTASGTLTTTITDSTERWFSGMFRYYAGKPSEQDDFLRKLNSYLLEAQHLYGVAPTASALWNLQPWSWAADWVTNIGDVLLNVDMFRNDGLVMMYGYMMEHKVRNVEYTWSGAVAKTYGNAPLPITTTQNFIIETKRRRKATPFGFGLELDGFTDRQWAILVALGITRGKDYVMP